MSDILKGGGFFNRYLIEATLTAQAPFHIGNGELKERNDLKDDDGNALKVSEVISDTNGKPYLPGSSTRGIMRQWLRECMTITSQRLELHTDNAVKDILKIEDAKHRDEKLLQYLLAHTSAIEKLFGTTLAEGKLEVWDATCATTVKTGSSPWLAGWRQDRITYVAKSVAIDPATGTAEDKKLYNFELVPEGVSFKLKLSGQNLSDEEMGIVLLLLNAFDDDMNPMTLGSMGKRGFGQFSTTIDAVYRLEASQLPEWRTFAQTGTVAGYETLKRDIFKLDDAAIATLRSTAPSTQKPDSFREKWSMKLETPMVIRSGGKFGWKNAPGSKMRNKEMKFVWGFPKCDPLTEVGDLNFSIRIEGDEAKPYYHIPSSSIRGALREWAVTQLLPKECWNLEQCIKEIINGKQKPKYLDDILSLFGFAIETGDKLITEKYTKAGRLSIHAAPFSGNEPEPFVHGTWSNTGNHYGPENATRHVATRNPIDRITHAARDGGLHSFLEFSAGQLVDVIIHIDDPTEFDKNLSAAWKEEINSGMIRFGGLTGVGRGRVSISLKEVCCDA